MAIYSCNLKSIGRTTHQPGTAGAHIRYIARPEAEPVVLAEHMPDQADQARNWMDRAERAARKNARLLDKIRIALPKELNEAQRAQLVRDFMAELTGAARVPWFAGIHQTGDDSHNPHVHIAVHDRDIDTGRRVLRLSDSTRDRIKAGLPGPKAVHWIRERWEVVCNRALERAGIDERIDRRTLEAQGIDRLPTIHVGPRASHIYSHVQRPSSQERINGCGRAIDYPFIDRGQTRRAFNAQIVDLNLERAARSDNPVRAAWAEFEKEQMDKDRALEERLARERRERTDERRNTANRYNAEIRRLRKEARLKQRTARRDIQERFARRRDAMRKRHRQEREALRMQQGQLFRRITAALDLTGTTRRRRDAARKMLAAEHKAERQALSEQYRTAQQAQLSRLKIRYETRLDAAHSRRKAHLTALQKHHAKADRQADQARQAREADREKARAVTERKIQQWRRGALPGGAGQKKAAAGSEPKKGDTLARAFRKAQQNRGGNGHSRDDSGRSR